MGYFQKYFILRNDMDGLLKRIQWTTLMFLCTMSVTIECLDHLGQTAWLAERTEHIILAIDGNYRMPMAIIVVLWGSAFCSAFINSFSVTVMMSKVIMALTSNAENGLSTQPLIWAAVFGASIGGSGSLYSSSANVVCACIAEQHGHKIIFLDYMK